MDDVRSSSTNSFEESGWTMYFEDFFATNNNNNNNLHLEDGDHDHHDQYHTSSSLISDAASLVAKNSTSDLQRDEALGLPIPGSRSQYSSRLGFKKRTRGGGVMVDNALEDTASSPVHSPKVYDLLSQSHKNTRQQDKMDISLQEKKDSETTELKKRGLCLVPLSMVVNYIG